jgi:cytochrome c-type biogenesis protein CcmH/NrfG
MELKLQQAIVATRAGRTDVAQHLLTQLIRENPNDANAWFLLGHLVDTPERQSRYLQKTVELDPGHAIAKQRLIQLEDSPIPAPVIVQPDIHAAVELESVETPPDLAPVETATITELPERLQDLDNKQLAVESTPDKVWQDSAGIPIREMQEASEQAETLSVPQNAPNPELASNSPSGEVWLVRTLVIMVIVAAIVLGILVLLILV